MLEAQRKVIYEMIGACPIESLSTGALRVTKLIVTVPSLLITTLKSALTISVMENPSSK